jgi:hypothetical protein
MMVVGRRPLSVSPLLVVQLVEPRVGSVVTLQLPLAVRPMD